MSCGVPRPLNPLQAAAILLTKEYNDRDAIFLRRFFGSLPSIKEISQAKWSLLKTFPTVCNLDMKTKQWNDQPRGRFLVSFCGTLGIKCSRIDFLDMFQYYLESAYVSEI